MNIIDKETYDTLHPTPVLKESKTRIYPYQGKESLEVFGTFKPYTSAFDQAIICKFYELSESRNEIELSESTNEICNYTQHQEI